MVQENIDFLFYSTCGSSMFPFIRGGDYIIVRKVPPEAIQKGDAIVFASETKTRVCHSVAEIKEKDSVLWFYTKGYKNTSYDSCPVSQEKILGKVIVIKRKSNAIELSAGGLRFLLLKLNCFLAENIFYLTKTLANIPFLKKIYRYVVKKI